MYIVITLFDGDCDEMNFVVVGAVFELIFMNLLISIGRLEKIHRKFFFVCLHFFI